MERFQDPQNPKEITVVLGVTREAVKSAKAGDIVSISVTGFMPKWTQTLVSHSKVSWHGDWPGRMESWRFGVWGGRIVGWLVCQTLRVDVQHLLDIQGTACGVSTH